MKAVGFKRHLPISDPKSLIDFTEPIPNATGHDLLVKVNAVSVNPVDVGVRKNGHGILNRPNVIGWDAVGIVKSVGTRITLFKPGDRVFYAGSFIRPGSDSEYQLVDERIVGHAPKTLDDAHAAAMPLTSLTAYESLFEQLEINPSNRVYNCKNTILIINGSGGVGSIATQLAHLAGLHVIATASRPATIHWVKRLGADQTANHRKNLVTEIHNLGYRYVDYILELNNIDAHWNEMAQLIKPNGRIASITENHHLIDLQKLTDKRVKFAWEWMYSKSKYHYDMLSQHRILDQIAKLLDTGKLRCTMTKTLHGINAKNLRKAHRMVETGHMIGKVTIYK